jgi:TP901 family phage tail tape measure protein
MADFVVTTAFKTRDEMSKTFKRMGLKGNAFANKLVKGLDRVNRKGLSTKRIIGGILGAAVIQRGLGLMGQGVRGVTQEFLDFEDAITAASAKFGILDRESPTFKAIGDTARKVGATTEFTATQAAEGMRFLAKAGWEVNASMKALPSFVNLATASEMEFARAADIATDVMGAFRLKSNDATENLKQLVRVNDVLSKAVNMSNIDMEDLFETIKFAGPIAKTAGVSLEQFSAMAAFIGGAGIKGSMGGTALRTMFLNLVAPTDTIKGKLAEFNTEIKNVKQIKDNRKALKALGIQLDETGKLSPIETLKTLSERMKDLGPTAKTSALNIIFGKRAVSAAAVSVDGASGALQDFEKQLLDSGGTAKQMAEFMRGSVKKRLDELKSAAIETGLKFFDAFKKKFPGGIDAAIKAVREFDIKTVVNAVKEGIQISKDFIQVLRDYKPILIGVAAAFAALKVGAFVASMWGLVGVTKVFLAAGGFTGLFSGLAVALGPIGAVALAIGGLSAGISALVINWDDLGQAIKLFTMDAVKWFDKLFKHPVFRFFMPSGQKGFDRGFFDEDTGQRKSLREEAKQKGLIAPDMDTAVKNAFESSKKLPQSATTVPAAAAALGAPSAQKLAEQSFATLKMLSDFSAAQAKGAKAVPTTQAPGIVRPDQNNRIKARPPNKRAVEAQKQKIEFEGRMDFARAPKGATVKSRTRGAPPVRTQLMGAN